MAEKWGLFESFFGAKDEESPVTDASSADNYVIEDLLIRYQEISKELTDLAAKLSADKNVADSTLQTLRETVTLAYGQMLDQQFDAALKTLRKGLNL